MDEATPGEFVPTPDNQPSDSSQDFSASEIERVHTLYSIR